MGIGNSEVRIGVPPGSARKTEANAPALHEKVNAENVASVKKPNVIAPAVPKGIGENVAKPNATVPPVVPKGNAAREIVANVENAKKKLRPEPKVINKLLVRKSPTKKHKLTSVVFHRGEFFLSGIRLCGSCLGLRSRFWWRFGYRGSAENVSRSSRSRRRCDRWRSKRNPGPREIPASTPG